MTIMVPNEGEVNALEAWVTSENWSLKLFTNNITPAETDTPATYTEASGGGYAAKTLTGTINPGTTWTSTSGAPSDVTYAQQTFTFSGALTAGATVYGYFITGFVSGDLLIAETQTAYTPANSGDQIIITPKVTAD